jgi:hypothetical protein
VHGRSVPGSQARPFVREAKGGAVAGPFIFISQSRIKEGRLDDFNRALREMATFVEANEPRVIAFEAYLNDDDTEVTGVQIHPDADSMAFHMQVAFEKSWSSISTWTPKASRSMGCRTTPCWA